MTMTETAENVSGFAIRCDANGAILEIIRSRMNFLGSSAVGTSFFDLVDRDSRSKAESFFTVLREQKAVFGWELNISNEHGKVESMHFAGAAAETGEKFSDENFLIVAGQSRQAVSRFYSDLSRLNNEQANSLRSALKDLSVQAREQTDRDNYFYNELSRLNNQLTTTQRELAKKNSELARLNEQKNQFLGMASHDLRNPLEVILQFSEFLLEDTEGVLEDEQVAYIRKISESSAFMLNLVNDFLDFSKIEAGRFELDKSRFDLPGLVRKVVDRHRLLENKKCIKIILNCNYDELEINADESKIEQVLNNLLGNAIKFSQPENKVELNIEKKETFAIISVKDYGAGIAKADIESLFTPFVKGTTKATGGEKGTGLGLTIARKIIEAHGGRINFETQPGKGTTFHVSLPI